MFSKKTLYIRSQKSVPKGNGIFHILLLTILVSLCCHCSAGTENLSKPNNGFTAASSAAAAASASASSAASAPASMGYQNAGTRTVMRVYDECSHSEVGFVPCLKKKAISFIDRISSIDAITVSDGIRLMRLPAAETGESPPMRPLSENELESASVPRSGEDRDQKLTNMLIERLSYFFNGHTLQVNFPKLSTEEIGRGLEEGRGKMKKMMSMMMMGMAMKMMGMIPIAMGALYMLAGKALIISKIALLLAGIMGLKKLMSGGGGGSSGGSSGWSSGGGGGGGWSAGGGGGGGGGGGWDRRSLNEAQDLVYRGYSRKQQQQVPLLKTQPQIQKS